MTSRRLVVLLDSGYPDDARLREALDREPAGSRNSLVRALIVAGFLIARDQPGELRRLLGQAVEEVLLP